MRTIGDALAILEADLDAVGYDPTASPSRDWREALAEVSGAAKVDAAAERAGRIAAAAYSIGDGNLHPVRTATEIAVRQKWADAHGYDASRSLCPQLPGPTDFRRWWPLVGTGWSCGPTEDQQWMLELAKATIASRLEYHLED